MAKSKHNGNHHGPAHPPPIRPNDEIPHHAKGSLVVIGGHESKEGAKPILTELAKRVHSGKLVVATIASEEPEEQWKEYQKVFRELSVKHVEHFDVRRREELVQESHLDILKDASVLFFGGGDQMKITSRLGGTLLCDRMREMYQAGLTVAGTSSGASVMSDVMMVAGDGDQSHEVGGSLRLGAGLGLISGVIIDQHFAERGRMGRLLGAVSQNPRYLGLGIDEDTAVVFDGDREFLVMGSGCVYVVDGRGMTYTNAAEDSKTTLSSFGLLVHVMSQGDRFNLITRTPENAPSDKIEEELAKER